MKNYVQSGDVLTVTAPAAVVSGQAFLVGSLLVVAQTDAATATSVAVVTCGVFDLPKLSTQAWAEGARVYWDDGNSRLTTVASGNTLVGVAASAAANPSPTGRVRLDGVAR